MAANKAFGKNVEGDCSDIRVICLAPNKFVGLM